MTMRTIICTFAAVLGLTTSLASASPLWQVQNGQTSIQFGDALVGALADCNLERIKQATLKPNEAKVRFRVVGGAVDAENLKGEAFHAGGISITCPALGEGPVVALQSFIIDLQQEPPVITGLVTVSGGEDPENRGRLALFSIGGDELEVQPGGNGKSLKVRNADLTPTQALAGVLSELGLVIEGEGAVARAWSRLQLRKPDNKGMPDDKGKPDDVGKPDDKGKPEDEDGGEED